MAIKRAQLLRQKKLLEIDQLEKESTPHGQAAKQTIEDQKAKPSSVNHDKWKIDPEMEEDFSAKLSQCLDDLENDGPKFS